MRAASIFPRILMAAGFLSALAQGEDADPEGFSRVVVPFIGKYCVDCHGPDEQKGRLRLDTLPNDFHDPRSAELWAEVVNAVNSHEMPPEDEPQAPPAQAGEFADWLAAALGRAEVEKRSTRVLLRRMNRDEYNNTIRDLLGVDFRPADAFPEDGSAGGFDNVGRALTISPMQMELYFAAANQALDRALVEGPRPEATHWRFDPEEDERAMEGSDRTRVRRGENNVLLNRGRNSVVNGFTVLRRTAWDRNVGFRDFKLPSAGDYIIRFRAAGRVPERAAVTTSARALLKKQLDQRNAENPKGAPYHQRESEQKLAHFESAGIYDYGAPRIKIIRVLGGTPETIAEMDVDAPESDPGIYEVRTRFTTASAGLDFEYAYEIPRHLENQTLIDHEDFARPELLIDWIEVEGPVLPDWPPQSHTSLLGSAELPLTPEQELGRVREILARFMPRAYRRPVTPAEVDAKVALFSRLREGRPSFVEAVKLPLAAVLSSPHFLYLIEPELPGNDPRPLDPHEVASRLSYFLWSSMPDYELSALAANGALAAPQTLSLQVDRMLADPRSAAFVKNFAGQWLGLRGVGSNPPVKTLYPEYDRHLELSIVRESEAFFAEILHHDLDARNLLMSDFVTINERLARFYGIPGVKGDAFRRVPVPEGVPRGGVVTQAAIHTITSNGTRTSPVLRGVWVLKTLLGTDPGLPLANVGEIPNEVPGLDKATVRQRLAIHREQPACARCHNKIDPLGLALENFDAAGQWRNQEGHGYNGRIQPDDPVIDASAKMPDGTEFIGVEGLQRELLKHDDQFLTALATQLTTYALGRELGFADRPALAAMVDGMKTNGSTLRALIHHIVASEAFLTK
jgi:mono/diheme cytochrome c family protein